MEAMKKKLINSMTGNACHLEGLSNTKPDWKVKSGLSPSKDPGDCSQIIDTSSCLSL